MKNIPNVENLIVVSEKIVKEAWEAIDKEPDSGFAVVLQAAEEYKAANMTPMFINGCKQQACYNSVHWKITLTK